MPRNQIGRPKQIAPALFVAQRNIGGTAGIDAQRNAHQLGLHLVEAGGLGIHRHMAHGVDTGNPAVQRGPVADAFVSGVVERQLLDHRRCIMRTLHMHALGRIHLGRVNLQPFRHPLGQGAELHLIQEPHYRLRLGVFQLQRLKRHVQRHIAIQLHQTPGNPDLLGIINQSLAPLGLLDLTRTGQKRIQIAVFLNKQSGSFQSDPRRTRHVINRVASQGLHIDHPVGGDTELLKHLVQPDALVLHWVQHINAVADQLHQVLVG